MEFEVKLLRAVDFIVDFESLVNLPVFDDQTLLKQYLLESLTTKEALILAADAINAFIGHNFTGHFAPCLSDRLLSTSLLSRSEFLSQCYVDLSFDLNRPFANIRRIDLLWIAKCLLVDQSIGYSDFPTIIWWRLRLCIVWQKALCERSHQLKEIVCEQQSSTIADLPGDLQVQFLLEKVHIFLEYFEFEMAQTTLCRSMEMAKIQIELIGSLGRRTRFQMTDIAQLVLQVESRGAIDDPFGINLCSDFPRNCQLEDDTLLEKPLLSNSNGVLDSVERLHPLQQCCVLAALHLEMSTHFKDEILIEKLNAYIDKIVENPCCWSIQASILLTRSELEKGKTRRVTRSCAQAETLLLALQPTSNANLSNTRNRCYLALASNLQPFWKVQTVHAEILLSLGCTSEALRIFESLQLWDQVVQCYKSLGKLELAESIVRRLIVERNDPIDYCLLGDITLNPEHYEKALEISQNRCARAFLSLGNFMLYQRKKIDEAYDLIEKSLQIQPLQVGAWFTLGHCAWRLERYVEATRAYQRCVAIEPDNFEAWNNLSAAFIRLGQKERALKILQESLKFNYENWRVWENVLILAVDVGQFLEAVRAYHRLLDLKQKHEDAEVLAILVTVARRKSENEDRDEMAKLKSELVTLMGRITAKQSVSHEVWRLYAKLKKPTENATNVDDYDKYVNLLQRTHQNVVHTSGWEKSSDNCERVMKETIELAHAQLKLAELRNGIDQAKAGVKMLIRPVILVVQKRYGTIEDGSLNDPALEGSLRILREILNGLD